LLSGCGLNVNARTGTDPRSELGVRFDQVAVVGADVALILRSRVAWAHDWITDPTLAPVFQALPGASFIVNGGTARRIRYLSLLAWSCALPTHAGRYWPLADMRPMVRIADLCACAVRADLQRAKAGSVIHAAN